MFDLSSNIPLGGIRARGWWGGRAQAKTHTGERPFDHESKVSLAGMSPLTATDRAFLRGLAPFPIKGISDADLGDYLDDWFAQDHYADNPVYTWTDNESTDR